MRKLAIWVYASMTAIAFHACGSDDGVAEQEVYPAPAVGTWRDPTSNLIWEVTPTDDSQMWENAKPYCATLTLDGGGWRLPSIDELQTLIRGCPATETGGSCPVQRYGCPWTFPTSLCPACVFNEGPAQGGMYWPDELEGSGMWYWSESSCAEGLDEYGHPFLERRKVVNFADGFIGDNPVASCFVRCVR